MSSRFVSGGTISGEGSKDESGHEVVAAAREPLAKKSVEWETVQHELDEERKRREQARAELAEGDSRASAKQAAFEEQNKLKNQFRALDDDEIEFLDEVRAKERAEEERARREVEEGLKAFRTRQKSTGGGETSGPARVDRGGEEEEEWADEAGGVDRSDGDDEKRKRSESESVGKKEKEKESEPPKEEKKTSLGLVAYDSDSDGDDDD
ncbi:hypothetical protein TrVFT333_000841 [Trichoderma virens FT-333]|nr:hypothetical protein TrVFT333_000841 [Trichoderma virens FT-333]